MFSYKNLLLIKFEHIIPPPPGGDLYSKHPKAFPEAMVKRKKIAKEVKMIVQGGPLPKRDLVDM